MKANERVTSAMLLEYDLDDVESLELKAFAVLDQIYLGMPAQQTYVLAGLTAEEVSQYEPLWEQLRKRELAHA